LLFWWGMDALSEVLKAVKLDSAFFCNGAFFTPWSFRSPNSCKLAPYINESSGYVIVYHVLIEGKAYGRLF
jgi:Cupin